MAKKNETVDNSTPVAVEAPVTNHVMTFRRTHPKSRVSYGIEGNAGIVVFDLGLFAGGLEPGFVPPATLTIDAALVPVKIAAAKVDKAAAQAAKLAEKAAAAQAKVEAAQAKAAERQAKAEAALAAAKAKLAAVGTAQA